jgi:hypothetical protein
MGTPMLEVTIQCLKHPTYQGKRKPVNRCPGCLKVYEIGRMLSKDGRIALVSFTSISTKESKE